MKYEVIRYESDPFDIMCGDCPVHEIEVWEEITLEELHEMHREFIEEDENIPDYIKDEIDEQTGKRCWTLTPKNFEEFLKEEISSGHIKVS